MSGASFGSGQAGWQGVVGWLSKDRGQGTLGGEAMSANVRKEEQGSRSGGQG